MIFYFGIVEFFIDCKFLIGSYFICNLWIFEQHCDNIDIKYFDELIEIDIVFIKDNVE